MPTILGRYSKNSLNFIKLLDETVVILNRIKHDENKHSLTIGDLTMLKNCINNSIVGASKLLHFINPSLYAIWDSRVSRYLSRKGYPIKDSPNGYFDYLHLVKETTNQNDYNLIHDKIQEQIKYPMTKFRTIELAMYLLGEK
jgi:hypothetical protein